MASATLFKNTGHQKKLEIATVKSVFGTFLLVITSLAGKNIGRTKGSLG
jgi:hypothetical protein